MSNAAGDLHAHELLSLIHQKEVSFDRKLAAVTEHTTHGSVGNANVSKSWRVVQHVKTALLEWCLHQAASAEAHSRRSAAVAGLWSSIAVLSSNSHVRINLQLIIKDAHA